MAADGSHPVLRRMARIAAAPTGPEPPVTPGRVLRRAATRAGEALGLAVSVAAISDERRTLDEVLSALDEADLLISLDRGDAGRGFAVIDLDLRDALVEVQTLGRLSDRPPPQGAPRRAVTAADAALGLPFLDGLLRGVAGAGPGTDLPDWTAGVAGGARYATRRAIGATLAAGDYREVALSLDLEGGRAGRLTLILPPVRSAAAAPPHAHGRDWAEAFRGSVQEASAVLTAVLTRHRIPLAEAEALRPGTVLPLPGITVGSVRLEAPPGEVLATARLGQVAGLRAVRLERRAPLELSGDPPGGGPGPGIVDAEAVDPWADSEGLLPDAPASIPPLGTGWASDIPDDSADASGDPEDAYGETGPPRPFDVAPAVDGGTVEDDPSVEGVDNRREGAEDARLGEADDARSDAGEDDLLALGEGDRLNADGSPGPAWPPDPAGPHGGGGLHGDVAPPVPPAEARDVVDAPVHPGVEAGMDGAGLPASHVMARKTGAGAPRMDASTSTEIAGDAGAASGPDLEEPRREEPSATAAGPNTFGAGTSGQQADGPAAGVATASGEGPAAWNPGTQKGPGPAAARFALAGDEARDFDVEGLEAPDAAIAHGLDVRGLRIDEAE